MAEFHLVQFQDPGTVRAGTLSRLTGSLEQNRVIINVINNIFAFPAMTSQNVKKSLLLPSLSSCVVLYIYIYITLWLLCCKECIFDAPGGIKQHAWIVPPSLMLQLPAYQSCFPHGRIQMCIFACWCGWKCCTLRAGVERVIRIDSYFSLFFLPVE